jgi:hypothetical protein
MTRIMMSPFSLAGAGASTANPRQTRVARPAVFRALAYTPTHTCLHWLAKPPKSTFTGVHSNPLVLSLACTPTNTCFRWLAYVPTRLLQTPSYTKSVSVHESNPLPQGSLSRSKFGTCHLHPNPSCSCRFDQQRALHVCVVGSHGPGGQLLPAGQVWSPRWRTPSRHQRHPPVRSQL